MRYINMIFNYLSPYSAFFSSPSTPFVQFFHLLHGRIALIFTMRPFISFLKFLTVFPVLLIDRVNALASTDTITWGGSNDRSGYQNNHNMDPAIVGSAQFGLLFKTKLPGTYPIGGQNVAEQIFSQPLVYTGSDGVQYLYIATTQNNVYKITAKTGVIVASRNLHRPFLVSDLAGCVDINPTIGITATGVIDPDTVCSS